LVTEITQEETGLTSSDEDDIKLDKNKKISFEKKMKRDKLMMEKFYKFCEYEKSTKRKRKSQEESKRRKLEDSKSKPEELYSESEEEERLNIQDSVKRKTSKSPILKKHKGNKENPAKTVNSNTDDRVYTYDMLKGDSSPLDYEPEEQEEANKSLDYATIVDTKSTAGPSKKDSDTEDETELLQYKSVCRKNSSNRCKVFKKPNVESVENV